MMKLRKQTGKRILGSASLAALLLCTATSTTATSVIPPSFEDLVSEAEVIFSGRVVSKVSEWQTIQNQQSIWTSVVFDVLSQQKGQAAPRVVLEFMGGTVGDTTLSVEAVPQFVVGDRAVLFVQNNGNQFCPLVGVHHGRFRIQTDAKTGADIVLMDDTTPLTVVAQIGTSRFAAVEDDRAHRQTSAQGSTAMSLAEFNASIAAKVYETSYEGKERPYEK